MHHTAATLVTTESFTPPGPGIFDLPPGFSVGGVGVTKPMLQLLLAALLVGAFFVVAARQRRLVPGKLQFAGEGAYGFVRNSVARDIIGSHDFVRFLPYLAALFFFVLVNNIFASLPFIQFPSGVGAAMLPLLVPLEFFSNIVVRPVTLALRLFCNMFAGHILLVLFSTGGLYLLENQGAIGAVAGPLAWVLAIAVSFLEILVQFLQAYVFVLLNAMYISGALAEEH